MSNKQPRLITVNNHPPELAVIQADNPKSALIQTEKILLKKDAPPKGVLWDLPDGQFNRALSYGLPEKLAALNQAGLVAFDGSDSKPVATLLGGRTEFRIRAGAAKLPSVFPDDAPFALQVLPVVRALKGVGEVKLLLFEKGRALPLAPHFDLKIAREAFLKSRWDKCAHNIGGVLNRNKFMRGQSLRILWNESKLRDDEQRIGTLFWSGEDVPELNTHPQYIDMLKAGDLVRAADIMKSEFPFQLKDAWQAPNRSVLFLRQGRKSSAFDLLPHSVMPKDKGGAPWTMHRIEI